VSLVVVEELLPGVLLLAVLANFLVEILVLAGGCGRDFDQRFLGGIFFRLLLLERLVDVFLQLLVNFQSFFEHGIQLESCLIVCSS
jgi:hypothetical protein